MSNWGNLNKPCGVYQDQVPVACTGQSQAGRHWRNGAGLFAIIEHRSTGQILHL